MEGERERLKLRDDPKLISSPSLDPAWQCGSAVVVIRWHVTCTGVAAGPLA